MIKKGDLIQMYLNNRMSMKEIADRLHCSVNKVQYWKNFHKIKSRSRSEATYIKANPSGDPFKIVKPLTKDQYFLLGMGLGLWWGEGNKRNMTAVRLGNTDPDLIIRFVDFLINICGVQSTKIRYGLQVFSDVDKDEAKLFWKQKLNITDAQFFPKVVVSESKKKGTYREKNKYGVLTVYVSNVKLRRELDGLMEKYL